MTDPEIKTKALALLLAGVPTWAAADQLGIARSLVFGWQLEARSAACAGALDMLPSWLRADQDDGTVAAARLWPSLFPKES